MNLFIIGMVIKVATEGVCIDPVYINPPMMTDGKTQI